MRTNSGRRSRRVDRINDLLKRVLGGSYGEKYCNN